MKEQDKQFLSTYSRQDLIDIFHTEGKKAQYWIDKEIGGDKGKRIAMQSLQSSFLQEPGEYNHFYNHKGDQFWWIYTMYVLTFLDVPFMGIAFCMAYGEDDDEGLVQIYEDRVVIYTSTFFDKMQRIWGESPDRDRTMSMRIFLGENGMKQWQDIDEYQGTDLFCVCDNYILTGTIDADRYVVTDVMTMDEYHALQESSPEKYSIIKAIEDEYNRAYEFLRDTHPDNSDNNKPNLMDKKMQETLRRIMKKHGLRDKYENLIESTRTTVEAWFNWVENIYAVSRLHSYITNDKDRPKFLSADKEWVEHVIRENKCSAIGPYVSRHTMPAVIQAVHYLMDNGLWEAPLGIEGIRKANADLYKGLAAIDEAIEYLRSEGKLQIEEQPSSDAQRPTPPAIEFIDDPATGKRTDAQRAFSYCKESFTQLQDRFATLSQYFDQDELTDLLEKENTKLDKEVQRLTESIKTVNQQLNEARKEAANQKQLAYEATLERNRHIDNFNKLKAQYDEQRENYEELKRQAQKAQDTPKVKIIPMSKILDIPLVGQGVLKGLIPLLKQYNVIVDENK